MLNFKNKLVPVLDFLCARADVLFGLRPDRTNALAYRTHFIPSVRKSATPPYFFWKRSRQENFRILSSSIRNLLNHCDCESNAFTLAEVLITLVIIGVIAAITVPTLMNKTNNQEYVSKLKKTYSTLAQATNLIIAEEGNPNSSKGGWAKSTNDIYKLYKKKLHSAKECGTNSGCFGQGVYKLLNNNNDGDFDNFTTSPKLVLADGVQIMFYDGYFSPTCQTQYYNNMSTNVCDTIFVDINGKKKPNKYGRDMFVFALKENGLYPIGCENDDRCSTSDIGNGCACKVLREGAMNY